jgi:hypothetical protein
VNGDGRPDLITVAGFGYGGSVLLNVSPVRVDLDVCPHRVSLSSRRRWLTATLTVPSPYRASDIDRASLRLNGVAATEIGWRAGSDLEGGHGHGGRRELTAKFPWAEVRASLEPGPRVPVTITGALAGERLIGIDLHSGVAAR